jgi:hypothetical protein
MQGLEDEQARLEQPQMDLAQQVEGMSQQQQAATQQKNDLDRKLAKATADAEKLLKALLEKAVAGGTAKLMK